MFGCNRSLNSVALRDVVGVGLLPRFFAVQCRFRANLAGKARVAGGHFFVEVFGKMDKPRRRPHITTSGRRLNAVRGIWKETKMAWKTPKIVEVPVGMEINMYACAARK